MALANFIDRTSQSLLQVLKTKDVGLLLNRLNTIRVAVAYTEGSLHNPNTAVLLQAAVSMMSRLYPRIAIIYKDKDPKGEDLRSLLRGIAEAINPEIGVDYDDVELKAVLFLGTSQVKAEFGVNVNVDGWSFEVANNDVHISLIGNSYNPITAVIAACFGLSEMFNYIFKEIVPRDVKVESYTYSLLDYTSGPCRSDELPPIHLEDLSLVGLGAVGNATAWCLSKITSLTGSLYLIDDEPVELSNLQRYLLTDQGSVNKLKIQIAAGYFEHTGLSVFTIPKELSEYARERGPDYRFNVIATSIDNAEDRIAAQALLPKTIINAWTGEDGYLGASRHYFDDPLHACLACLYLNREKQKSDVDKLADVTGLDVRLVAEILVQKIPLSKEHIATIVRKKKYPLEIIERWEGRLITDFYAQAICGGILLKYRKNEIEQLEAVVPLVHQSVLAGALLAAEIVKHFLKINTSPDNVEIKMDIFSKPGSYACQRRAKTMHPKCICTDKDYISTYRSKWS